jgi:meso-butanediol dehydrogenase/(S,S)-butanediol dehydrogenase/diacetyl reductase
MNRFTNRSVVVTGAGSGIGRATAHRLASEGAVVSCIDINENGLSETMASLDRESSAHVLDIRDEERVGTTIDEIVATHGGVDVLCNIAGVLDAGHSEDYSLEDWNRVVAINLTGTFLMTRACLPSIIERRGNIVMAASTSSFSGHPWMLAYAATKGGILSMTYTLAVEYARRGVRVNAVAPGGINTPMTASVELPDDADFTLLDRISPLDEFRGPETVASTIAFLASDDAAHVNGEVVRVDGATLA